MSESLYKLINFIIAKYLLNSYCLTIISDTEQQIANISTQSIPTINFFLEDKKDTDFNDFILRSLDLGCSDYIIYLENPEKLVELFEENIHVTNQRRDDRKLIFLPKYENQDSKIRFLELLNLPAIGYVLNTLIILPDITQDDISCISFELVTHKYIGKYNTSNPLHLDNWLCNEFKMKSNANLFPDKVSNLEGRIMKVATFKYKPYSILEFDSNNEVIGYDGTEMRTAVEFCRWSNCELEIIRDDEHEWGEVWDNRTGNGIIGNIVMDKADFGFAALYSWYHEYGFLDLTTPVVRTGITCIAPAPQLLASYLLPVLPFNKVLWYCVFGSILYSSIALYLTGKMKTRPLSKTMSLISVIGIILAQNPLTDKLPKAMKQVINMLFFLSLLLSNIYSSGLASTITVPIYEPPIDTVDNLVDSNLNWGATHDAWIFSILEATEPNMVHLVKFFKKWSYEKLRSRGITRDFAYSVERLPAGYFAIGEYVTEESVSYLQLMSQDIYFEYCVLMARKSSPYTDRLNTLIGRLHQAGLIHAWETQVVLKYSDYRVQLGVRLSQGRHSNPAPRALNIRQLQGPLYLWGLGTILATVIFIFELALSFKKKRKISIE